jgi:hypothetical protein
MHPLVRAAGKPGHRSYQAVVPLYKSGMPCPGSIAKSKAPSSGCASPLLCPAQRVACSLGGTPRKGMSNPNPVQGLL